MQKPIFLTLLSLNLMLVAVLPGSAFASEALLRNFLTEVETVTAQFEQRVVDSSGQTLDMASGNMYLSRPGKFRWDFDGEEGAPGQQLVADGKSIFVYDPDLEQVTQRSMEDAINQVPSLLLVQDKGALDTFFSVGDIGLTDGQSWVSLKPKSEDAGFQQLMLGFSNQRLTEIQVLDGLGNETQLRLRNVRNNQKIRASKFKFKVPEGADVYQQ